MDGQTISEILLNIYRRLMERYGPQHWWPAREPFEVIVGAILAQSTAWTNVDKAIASLRTAGKLSPRALRQIPDAELARLIYSCGYYNVKARKLKAFAEWFGERYYDDLNRLFSLDIDQLRPQLLGVYGIGEETADAIILYAGNKPIFVIDAYTRRIISRLGLAPDNNSYAAYQALFTANLPADTRLYNEYHALLTRLAKEVCRTRPLCHNCCLNETGKDHSAARFPCSSTNNAPH
jgi:endonuclease-3 related protein